MTARAFAGPPKGGEGRAAPEDSRAADRTRSNAGAAVSATDATASIAPPSTGPDPAAPVRPGTVLQGGRRKAFRPLPVAERRSALAEAVTAYSRGDFFLAHELLEPAWMGTADELERFLYQGLIKLAAAYVHDVRGNPRGRAKNLVGARRFLGAVLEGGGDDAGFDLPALLDEIDGRLAEPPARALRDAPGLVRRAGQGGRSAV